MSLNDFADRSAAWVSSRFPTDTIEWRGLVLAEETGEAVRCIVKMQAGQRGTPEQWMAELYTEVADVFLALQALCNHTGIDLHRAVTDRWEQIRDRDVYARRLPSES